MKYMILLLIFFNIILFMSIIKMYKNISSLDNVT